MCIRDRLKGEQVEKIELDEENLKARNRGLREAKAEPVLLGITKACLLYTSRCV